MAATKPRRGGRPSQLEASRIGEKILAIATELFLTQGYGATSIESIAQAAAISKRTFYHRFRDKAELFAAVVHRLMSRLRPADTAPLFTGGDLEAILYRLAQAVLQGALSPEALALHRLLLSEAARFPELAVILDNEGARCEAIARIAGLLEGKGHRHAAFTPAFAAEQFLQMVVSIPQRRALGMGTPMSQAELNDWARGSVRLFLQGHGD